MANSATQEGHEKTRVEQLGNRRRSCDRDELMDHDEMDEGNEASKGAKVFNQGTNKRTIDESEGEQETDATALDAEMETLRRKLKGSEHKKRRKGAKKVTMSVEPASSRESLPRKNMKMKIPANMMKTQMINTKPEQ